MARRWWVGEIWLSSFSGLRSLGTKSTRSRPHASIASCAAARCPRWGGSNVPPNTPMVTGGAHNPSPGVGRGEARSLPLQLDVAEPDVVTGAAAGRLQRLQDAHPLERGLEHLDGIRVG